MTTHPSKKESEPARLRFLNDPTVLTKCHLRFGWWTLLVFLTLGHLAIMHVLGGGVERVSFDFVAARWHGMFWRTYDWLLLSLAIVHGANGARVVIDDYVHRDGWRALLKTLLLAATFLFLVLGTFVIVTFNPGTM